jgi:ankyrin repeat protein
MSQVYAQDFVDRVLAYQGAPRTIPDLLDPSLVARILEAMRQSDLALVSQLIQEDNGYGDPLLFWLLKEDRPLTEKFTAEFHRQFDIFLAAFFALESRVRALLHETPDLAHTRNNRNWTALDVAAHEGHLEMVRLLLAAGAQPDTLQPMLWAAQNGFANVVELLLLAGAGAEGKAKQALSRAVYRNRPEAMQVLLAHGVNPRGLLACAAYGARVQGKVDILRTLIRHGADANEKDEKGQNALYSQISFYGDGPNQEITDFLRENGAEVDIFNASGLGLLGELRGFLHADPALANARSASGLTPLHFAAMGNQLAAAQILVAAGADKTAVVSASNSDRPVDKVRPTDGQYVTCDTEPLRHFLMT